MAQLIQGCIQWLCWCCWINTWVHIYIHWDWKCQKRSAHIDQFPYRHQKGYLGVTYQNCDTFIRLAGKPPKVTCDSTFLWKCFETCFNLIWICWTKKKEFPFFWARERPQNCNVINWVINYGSGNAQLQLITLFMLLGWTLWHICIYIAVMKIKKDTHLLTYIFLGTKRAIWLSYVSNMIHWC